MGAEADVYIYLKESKHHLADKYWQLRSRLLLPHRLWLPLARVSTVMLAEKVLGSIWTPCRPHNPEIEKAVCLYFNSTPGLLSLLGARDNRKPSYPSFSLDTLRALSVPDFTALDPENLVQLNKTFDKLRHAKLKPLPEMDDDYIRRLIDDSVVKELGLDADWIGRIRRGLALEPSVTNSPTYAA